MKRPSFQFYPGDWTVNSNLKRCTHAEKGVWLEIMCLMHDQEEYGVLRWPLKEIVEAVKCRPADVKALVSKGVLKGSDTQLDEPFVYTPRSGRKDGTPVTLLPVQAGPIWYSSRMAKDEYVRTIRGESTRFGDGSDAALNPPFGDGTTTSSSSSTSLLKPPDGGSAQPSAKHTELQAVIDGIEGGTEGKRRSTIPPCPHQKVLELWAKLLPTLPQHSKWTSTRAKHLQARWREAAVEHKWQTEEDGLRFFAQTFRWVAQSKFLMGQVPPTPPRTKPFTLELAWLCEPENFAQIIEGKYHE